MESLRDKPQTGGMFADVEVQDVATAVADHKETVQPGRPGDLHPESPTDADVNRWVESRCGAVVQSRVGVTGPSWPSVPRKQLRLRFHTPLIKPDVPVSGIRLSDGLHR